MSLARLAGAVLDAHVPRPASGPIDRALAARWIAGNVLAAKHVQVTLDGRVPRGPQLFALRVDDLDGVLAAIAVVPALVDATHLPMRWRLALAALGVPLLDQPVEVAIAGGASVFATLPTRHCLLVRKRSADHRVCFARTLAA